ncbi:hypothetical protein DFS34DRAFT_644645 [Phlyctochytrium arcticum]|nr:hypothetical protein DFS34DRAFT_644645 [Phlyctochytrium arcticum]
MLNKTHTAAVYPQSANILDVSNLEFYRSLFEGESGSHPRGRPKQEFSVRDELHNVAALAECRGPKEIVISPIGVIAYQQAEHRDRRFWDEELSQVLLFAPDVGAGSADPIEHVHDPHLQNIPEEPEDDEVVQEALFLYQQSVRVVTVWESLNDGPSMQSSNISSLRTDHSIEINCLQPKPLPGASPVPSPVSTLGPDNVPEMSAELSPDATQLVHSPVIAQSANRKSLHLPLRINQGPISILGGIQRIRPASPLQEPSKVCPQPRLSVAGAKLGDEATKYLSSCNPGETCDILCVISALNPVERMVLQKNKYAAESILMATMMVADESTSYFMISLWREKAKWVESLSVGEVILLRGVKIKSYKGQITGTSTSFTTLHMVHHLTKDSPIEDDLRIVSDYCSKFRVQEFLSWAGNQIHLKMGYLKTSKDPLSRGVAAVNVKAVHDAMLSLGPMSDFTVEKLHPMSIGQLTLPQPRHGIV